MDENNLNNNEPQIEEEEVIEEATAQEEKSEETQNQDTPQNTTWNNSPYATDNTPAKQSNAMGIASMVLGIVSVVSMALCCIPFFAFLPLICGVPGIVLGIIGMKSCPKRGYAIAGIIMSAISIVLTVIMLVLLVIFAATGNLDEMIRKLEYSIYI